MLVDTHCHLDFDVFNFDRDKVLSEARSSGTERFLNPGIDIQSCRKVIQISDMYSEVFAAVGIHPNEAWNWSTDTISELRDIVGNKKVIAIGEIGLDYYREKTSHEQQRQVFVQQLELAAMMSLPVIIHTRNSIGQVHNATNDALAILRDWCDYIDEKNPKLRKTPGIMHSFSDEYFWAKSFYDLGFMLGISGPITYKNATFQHEYTKKLPIEAFVIETDSPYLPPNPYRGQRNQPKYVRYIAERIAQLRNETIEHIVGKTTINAGRVLGW